MAERVILSRAAIPPTESVASGRIMLFHEAMPLVGRHCSVTANIQMSMSPSQKPGTAANSSARTVIVVSSGEYCFTADMTPRGIPIVALISIENIASFNVVGNRTPISFATGSLVR